VSAESTSPDRGATFTVDLPRAPETRLAAPASPLAERPDDRLLAGVRVLLVDVDLGIRESFQAVLESQGALVTTAASAPEALGALEQKPLDVLLFGDLATRGDTVYDLIREVTARACPVPIASISAWRLAERERALAAGFRLHLGKPLEIEVLVEAVAQLAGRSPGKAQRLRRLPGAEPTPM
jgi:CheY-like chemotaxis protein